MTPPPRRLQPPPPRTPKPSTVAPVLDERDATVLDLVDNLLTRGAVLKGDLVLALAGVDLVYLRLSLLLAAADRVLAPADWAPRRKRRPVSP